MFTGILLLLPHSPLVFPPCFAHIQFNSLPTIWTPCSNIWMPGAGYCICGTGKDNANYKNEKCTKPGKVGGGGKSRLKWWGFSLSQRNWRFWSHLQRHCLGLGIKKYLHIRPILVSVRGFYSQFPKSITPPPPGEDTYCWKSHHELLVHSLLIQSSFRHLMPPRKKWKTELKTMSFVIKC